MTGLSKCENLRKALEPATDSSASKLSNLSAYIAYHYYDSGVRSVLQKVE